MIHSLMKAHRSRRADFCATGGRSSPPPLDLRPHPAFAPFMRIISGEFRNRRLHTPRDASITRPIPDRVKESLFALLRGWTEGASVLDAFAGTGAIGLEAISRGAARCVFIERDKRIVELIRRNVEELGCDDRAEVVMGDALGPVLLSRCPRPVDLAFFDPPYPLVRDRQGWARLKLQIERVVPMLAEKGFLTLRTPWPFRIELPGEGGEGVDEGDGSSMGQERGMGRPGRDDRDDEDEARGRAGRGARSPRPSRSEGQREKRRHKEEDPLSKVWEGEALREFEASGFAGADRLDEDDDDHGRGHDDDHESDTGEGGLEELTGAQEAEAAAVEAKRTEEGDLTIAGAVGPETHVYGHTAIHLYMRQPAPSATTGG